VPFPWINGVVLFSLRSKTYPPPNQKDFTATRWGRVGITCPFPSFLPLRLTRNTDHFLSLFLFEFSAFSPSPILSNYSLRTLGILIFLKSACRVSPDLHFHYCPPGSEIGYIFFVKFYLVKNPFRFPLFIQLLFFVDLFFLGHSSFSILQLGGPTV